MSKPPRVHVLKLSTDWFDDVKTGLKKAELRKNDRDFQSGEWLDLREWNGQEFTGRNVFALITHVLSCGDVIDGAESWVVLSIEKRSFAPGNYAGGVVYE